VEREQVLLGPAQRADVVVDFGDAQGQTIRLDSVPLTDGTLQGIGPRPAQLMEFRVGNPVEDESQVPDRLLDYPGFKVPDRVSATWTFGLDGDQETGTLWTINDRGFDPQRVEHTAVLGTTERWRLSNTSPVTHYVHLHEELWRTLSRDGERPPPWERGFEDTWRLDPGETVEVGARFTDYTGRFMVHCHMLDHEDHGMMAQFRVVRPGSRAAERAIVSPHLGHHHSHGH
jgi:FtsP/CotA-like multicopper oxidase with cupredoxin domain